LDPQKNPSNNGLRKFAIHVVEGILIAGGAIVLAQLVLIYGFHLSPNFVFSPNILSNVQANQRGVLSYQIEDPSRILDNDTLTDDDIRINNVSSNRLYLRRVGVWNSGQVPIENFSINFSFDDSLLGSIHNASPTFELRKDYGFKQVEKTKTSERDFYGLINPTEGFKVSFFTNGFSPMKVKAHDKNFELHNAKGPGFSD